MSESIASVSNPPANPTTADQGIAVWNFRFSRVQSSVIIVILLLALFSRFLFIGVRAMDHDEVNHVVPAWELFTGKGYAHSPVTHGPLQFHLLALSYFLLGDTDFASRVPAALFSLAAVAFVIFAFPRYLGRWGAVMAGLFFTISPYLLYYGRYTRNEGFIELFAVLMLYAVLRHLDRGDKTSLYLFTTAMVLHLVTKETAWIYTALIMIFLALVFLLEVQKLSGRRSRSFMAVMGLFLGAMIALLSAILLAVANARTKPAETPLSPSPATPAIAMEVILVLLAVLLAGAALLLILRKFGWKHLRELRSVNLLILSGSLILPQLSAFIIHMLGWNPLDYTSTPGLLRSGGVLLVVTLASIGIGILWNSREWWKHALIFYIVYVFFYTTMFTNGNGFFTGIIGSLGYWLSQQAENRGTQPLYYYWFLQMPVYEYLGYAGMLLALWLGLRHDRLSQTPGREPSADQQAAEPQIPPVGAAQDTIPDGSAIDPAPDPEETGIPFEDFYKKPSRLPVLFLLVFWAVTTLVAFSLAGEKMPWLTVHITMPFLLTSGWAVGWLIETTRWKELFTRPVVYALLILPLLFISAASLLTNLLGANPPFAGKEITQLQATNTFLQAALFFAGSAAGLWFLLRRVKAQQIKRLVVLGVFGVLTLLTARVAYQSSFINGQTAREFLVYAHATEADKKVFDEIEDLSFRLTRGRDLVVAYSGDGLYPYWWYLRNYPNKKYFLTSPTRELRDADVIIAGRDVMNKMGPIVGERFLKFSYIRLWWPMQAYTNLTWDRVRDAVTDPQMRQALWDIWFNRDYTRYAAATNDTSLTLENWQPSDPMDVYINKDIAAKVWSYGSVPALVSESKPDPYEEKVVQVQANRIIGDTGSEPGMFNAPRGVALAADGSFYVADSRNNRIQHFDRDGQLINLWGSFADLSKGDAPGGTFYEPWGVVVGKNGNVFVTDTWNHRIQQFRPDGTFVSMWGYFGQAERPDAFWGPRALAVDNQGMLYVSDTGNKRVVVFDEQFNFIAQFGTAGLENGQFDEPVGLAVDKDGLVYVADTWNQRVQVFRPDVARANFAFVRQWEINGWMGQSLDNKPFLAISPLTNRLYAADPEGSRVLIFDGEGNFVSGWGDFGSADNAIGLVGGLAVDLDGQVWVADAGNNRLMRFQIP